MSPSMCMMIERISENMELFELFLSSFIARGLSWSRHSSSTASRGNVTLQEHLVSRIKVESYKSGLNLILV